MKMLLLAISSIFQMWESKPTADLFRSFTFTGMYIHVKVHTYVISFSSNSNADLHRNI